MHSRQRYILLDFDLFIENLFIEIKSKNVITEDESWVSSYDIETNAAQSSFFATIHI